MQGLERERRRHLLENRRGHPLETSLELIRPFREAASIAYCFIVASPGLAFGVRCGDVYKEGGIWVIVSSSLPLNSFSMECVGGTDGYLAAADWRWACIRGWMIWI